ncbi:MAG: hypothetical protein ACE5IM_03415, partial [Nitrospinota bacterium]
MQCFGVPILEVDGYEADDVIGTQRWNRIHVLGA